MTDACVATGKTAAQPQPWLCSGAYDGLWIIAPAFVSSAIALAFRTQMENSPELPLWAWVCFVLLIDVAHVYATLFRTYFNERAVKQHGTLLITIPLLCWVAGSLLYSMDALLFWRALTYVAVFHFIRQQYGFVALYSRRDSGHAKKFAWLDQLLVYASTIYPLMFWHTHLPRHFSWFVEGDFIQSVPAVIAQVGLYIYAVVAVSYVVKEAFICRVTGTFNVPKNLILVGTAISWWVGIISLNSDLAFTMTNVVSHGIPYMALIWLYHNESAGAAPTAGFTGAAPTRAAKLKVALMSFAPAFFVFLVLLAYLEEGLWDGFVWREHLHVFAPFAHLPAIVDPSILAILVPFLALPQSTHYVLDGFIWKVKDRSSVFSGEQVRA